MTATKTKVKKSELTLPQRLRQAIPAAVWAALGEPLPLTATYAGGSEGLILCLSWGSSPWAKLQGRESGKPLRLLRYLELRLGREGGVCCHLFDSQPRARTKVDRSGKVRSAGTEPEILTLALKEVKGEQLPALLLLWANRYLGG